MMGTRIHISAALLRHAALAIAILATVTVAAPLHAQTHEKSPTKRQMHAPAAGEPQSEVLTVEPEGDESPANLAVRAQMAAASGAAARAPVPATPGPLSQEQLDALKLPDPEPGIVVPLRGYPTTDRLPEERRPIFARASIGMHATLSAEAGISGSTWPFDYNARVEAAHTAGFEPQGEASRIVVDADGGYVIGDSYGIFSGGYMGVGLNYTRQAYDLYAVDPAPQRTLGGWSVRAFGKNTFDGVHYDATGRFRSFSASDDSAASSEHAFEGSLTVDAPWNGMRLGGRLDLRLTGSGGNDISFGSLNGFLSRDLLPMLTLRAGGSISIASGSTGHTSARVAPVAELRFRPVPAVALIANLHGGIAQNTLAAILGTNPYAAIDGDIEPEIESIGYSASLRIEPSVTFGARITAARSFYSVYSYFDQPVAGRFAPMYAPAALSRVDGDFFWDVDDANRVTGLVTWVDGRLDDDAPVPYVPDWTAEASYTRQLQGIPLQLTGTLRYIGSRSFPASSNGETLQSSETQPAWLVGCEARYALGPWLGLTLEIQNMAHQRYQLWDGYRERGFYAALGADAKF